MGQTPKGLLAGHKFSGRHTTIIPPARPLIALIKGYSQVNKIIIGIILARGGKQQRIRFKYIMAGLELKVIGSSAAQIFYIYTAEPDTVRQQIQLDWAKLRGENP